MYLRVFFVYIYIYIYAKSRCAALVLLEPKFVVRQRRVTDRRVYMGEGGCMPTHTPLGRRSLAAADKASTSSQLAALFGPVASSCNQFKATVCMGSSIFFLFSGLLFKGLPPPHAVSVKATVCMGSSFLLLDYLTSFQLHFATSFPPSSSSASLAPPPYPGTSS